MVLYGSYDLYKLACPDDNLVVAGECICGQEVYYGETAYQDEGGEWTHDDDHCLAIYAREILHRRDIGRD